MMSASFNPYHKWLAIPPEDQPANHYRLLAIELWEDDVEVIANAAEQRISHLRILEMGEQGETASELIAEITAARDCLLDPAARAGYEEQLRGVQRSAPQETSPVLADAIATESVGSRATAGDAKTRERTSTRKKGKQNTKKAKKVRLLGHILAPIIGLALGGVILWVIKSMPSEEKDPGHIEFPDWVNQEEATQGQQSSTPSSEPSPDPMPNPSQSDEQSGDPQSSGQQGADTTEPTAEFADQKEIAEASGGESPPTDDSAAIAEEDIAEEDIATETASDDPAVDFPDPFDTGAELSPEPSPPAEEESPGFDAAIAELEEGLEEAIAEGALLRQLELVERLMELTGDDGWGQQLELFGDYQQRDQRDETLIARAALLLSDRAALEGRIEEARALAADGLRAARRERNPRLERLVTMRILELPLGESE